MILVFIVGADDTRRLIRAAVGSGVVIALLAIIQAGWLHEVRALGIYRLDAASSPNYLAFALAPLVPLVGAVAIRQSWLRFAVGIVLLLALFLSGSRAGLVAAGVGFIISIVLSSEQFWKQRLVQSICLIALIFGLVGSWLVVRPDFSASSETGGRIASSNNIRWQIWGVTGELVRSQPLTGLGLGNYQQAFGELTLRRVNFSDFITPEARTPHNLAVGLWTDTGILGLLAFMTVLVLVGKSLAVAVKQPAERALAAALIGSWFVLLAHGLVDMPIWKNDLMVLFWLLVALPILITFKQDRRSLPL
jgi:O-antigen ligase